MADTLWPLVGLFIQHTVPDSTLRKLALVAEVEVRASAGEAIAGAGD
jgi:hypothetical protein